MFKKSLIALFVLTLLLTACATARATAGPQIVAGAPPLSKDMPSEAARAPSQGEGMSPNTVVAAPVSDIQRLVIMNADLGIVVVDPPAAVDTITKMAQDMQGYVVSTRLDTVNTSSGTRVPVATITIRVPSDKLNTAIDQIKSLVKDPKTDITSENISGQDVTKEFVDLQSQLTNLEQAETQLQKIMDSATKTEDVMMVYNQLVQVRQQIEMIKGQMKYYEDSARLSAITVNLQAQESVTPVTIGNWQLGDTASNAMNAMLKTVNFLTKALIWILIFAIPFVVIGLIIWLCVIIIKAISRKTKKNQPTPPVA